MIRLLNGTVHSLESQSILLLVNGVGYQVFVPQNILEELREDDSAELPLTLHIHSHIREDAFTLYGFRSTKALEFFEMLLGINGVGPKMALAILDEPHQDIQNAIFTGNIAALTKISGVGKKTAERIILELKSKVTPTDLNEQVSTPNSKDVHPDALATLETLGYKRHHIHRVLVEVDHSAMEAEEIIRVFLQNV